MAKLPPENFTFPGRGVSLKGSFYTRRTKKGFTVVRWPRRQPTPATALQADRQKLIALAARVTAYMTPQEQAFARKVADATKLLPRDFLMLALFGRIGTFIGKDGKKRYSLAAMQDVSQILDALGQVKGDLLYRGVTWWDRLPIGDIGELLTVGPDGLPIWEVPPPPPSSGEPFMAPLLLKPTASAVTFATGAFAAYPIMASQDVVMTGVRLPVRATGTSKQIVAGLYEDVAGSLSGGTLVASTAATAPALGTQTLPFQSPVTLTALRYYYLGLINIGGSGNFQLTPQEITRNSTMFFTHSTTSLPATAPTATVDSGATQYTWWGY